MRAHELEELRADEQRRPPEPAPPPLHALLALQRAAGNQAVGRILARNKIKGNTAKAAVTAATKRKPAPTTAAELLLSIYNKLGEGQGGPWATAEDAVTALKGAQVIDDGDVEFFKGEADRLYPKAGGGSEKKKAASTQLKQEIEADREAILKSMGEHVLRGAWRTDNRPGGYHTKNGGSQTHEGYGTATKLANDTYQQSVREIQDNKNVKPTQSTFFPDSASADDVIDAITSVYGTNGKKKQRKTVAYPDDLAGIPLTQRDGTAFPDTAPQPLPGEGYDDKYKPKKH
jgi:hypothetical protein